MSATAMWSVMLAVSGLAAIPAFARPLATVAVGSTASVAGDGSSVFVPVGASPISGQSFTPAVPGDYVFNSSSGFVTIRAVDLQQWNSSNFLPSTLLSDSFTRNQSPVVNSDSESMAWCSSGGAFTSQGSLVLPPMALLRSATTVLSPFTGNKAITMNQLSIGCADKQSCSWTAALQAVGDPSASGSICNDAGGVYGGVGFRLSASGSDLPLLTAFVTAHNGSVTELGKLRLPSDCVDSTGSISVFNLSLEAGPESIGASLMCNTGGTPVSFTTQHELDWRVVFGAAGATFRLALGLTEQDETLGVNVSSVSVSRSDSFGRIPAVLLPIPNLNSLGGGRISRLGQEHDVLAKMGVLDATLPPFSVDRTGQSVTTEALQAAINYARTNYLTLYLPAGVYLVDDTLDCRETERMDGAPGMPHNFWQGARYAPVVIRGERGETAQRTVIRLAQSTFTNASDPHPVLFYWMMNAQGDTQGNANCNSICESVDVEIGENNPGAIGVTARGAQGIMMMDMVIKAGDGLAGLSGAAGSGGAHVGVTVIGGRYGFDLTLAQPGPSITGFTSVNAKCAGIAYAGLQALSGAGINITSGASGFIMAGIMTGCPYPALPDGCELPQIHGFDVQQCGSNADAAMLSLVDSVIDLNPSGSHSALDGTAILANASVFLRNTYVRGASVVAAFPGDISLQPASGVGASDWTEIGEFAQAVEPVAMPYGNGQVLQLHARVYINYTAQTTPRLLTGLKLSTEGPPASVTRQHLFYGMPMQSLPGRQSPGAVVATDYGAIGDGVADDTAALQAALNAAEPGSGSGVMFVPRGIYRVSNTIHVPTGVVMVGAGLHLTSIVTVSSGFQAQSRTVPDRSRGPSGSRLLGAPIVRVGSTPSLRVNGTPIVSGLGQMSITVWAHMGEVSAFEWNAPAPGIYWQMHTNRLVECGIGSGSPLLFDHVASIGPAPPACLPPTTMTVPLATIYGKSAGGKFYSYYNEDPMNSQSTEDLQGPDYRHLLALGTSGGLQFYHLNPEHCQSDADSEFADSSDVLIVGVKSEGTYPPVWVASSTDLLLTGHGGLMQPPPAGSNYPSPHAQFKPAVYRVTDSSNITLANVWRYVMNAAAIDGKITAVYAMDAAGLNHTTALLDRPAVWKI